MGDYSDLDVVPKEFIRLLCEGQGNLSDLSMRRELTIQGFVIPVTEGNAEFHRAGLGKTRCHVCCCQSNSGLLLQASIRELSWIESEGEG